MNANRNPGLDIVRALAVLTVVISTEPLSSGILQTLRSRSDCAAVRAGVCATPRP
jgi:hypothetical protein